MKEYLVKIEVSLKSVVLDPQGKTVLSALKSLGFENVEDARIGKLIELKTKGNSEESVRSDTIEMCEKLLANPVIEDYSINISEI
ncbi:MAG: phosphoribosylformylglycinamidine synthase subunit PurS [Candidatus Dadabacteria bacterium]|nr:phosphoribosylformylglycinamidine synthase subunit PurS [Candidatus Dadabacteria bacterium]NIQ14228.1 phosphoribosylformylglycinamidine synthase subunit PurS [Candidatus Dadabacteria bacterium]